MRINYVMFSTHLTGGARVLFEIANRLVYKGNHVTITSLGTTNDHTWFPLKAKSNPLHKTVFGELLYSGLSYGLKRIANIDVYPHQQIVKLINKTPDCDVNVATFCFTAFAVFRSGKGIPFYHMQHYEPLMFNNSYLRKMSEETYYLPLNQVANSIWLKNQIKDRYGYDVPVVNPAIDHSVFYPRDVKKHEGEFRILCFGKQERWKGFPEALQAMGIVMKKRRDIKFIAYGTQQPLFKSNVPYEFVKSPSDDELARLYSSADIVVCPSWYESFPLYPLEAMGCGVPIITTPHGTEDYAFHEKNCLVVQPRNPGALADAVLRLLSDEDLRERFSKEGLKVVKQFTWDKTVDKIESLFRRALRSGSNR